jgi:major membrane immunogen (membrane-anchored lipoprotein)
MHNSDLQMHSFLSYNSALKKLRHPRLNSSNLSFILLVLLLLVSSVLFTGCQKQEGLQDGYYTVEMAEYSNGWKEFVTICVSNGEIVTVEYNAKNSSGFIKSWDMPYMARMNSIKGTYPNYYTRAYGASFLASQDADKIDAVTGATHSGENFHKMAAALLEKAANGDTSLGIIE